MTSGIYRLTFKKTGEFYVGSSVNIERRVKQHFYGIRAYVMSPQDVNERSSGLTRTSLLMGGESDCRMIAKEFEYEILEVVNHRSSLLIREVYWYDQVRPTLNKTRPCATTTRNYHT